MSDNLIQTPEFVRFPRVQSAWQQSLWIANTCFVLLVMAGGLLLMGHETVQTSYSVKDVAPRLVVAFMTTEFSRLIVEKSVHFANALARALAGPGIAPDAAVKVLGDRLSNHISSGSIFLVILVLVAAFMACILVATYAIRVMVLMVLLVGGPLALACQALPQTEAIARVWWRILLAVLLTQVVQSLVFLIAIEVLFTPDGSKAFTDNGQFWDMVLVICLLYVLVRVPVWVWHLVVQGSAPRSSVSRVGTYLYVRYQVSRAHRGFRGTGRERGGGRRPGGGWPPGGGRRRGGGQNPPRQPGPRPFRAQPTYYGPRPGPSSAQPGGQPQAPRQPAPRPAPQPPQRPASGSPSTPQQPSPRRRPAPQANRRGKGT
ncbi:conjugal transfer protein TrbL family protein [Spirillospora sp. NPDC052269]